MKGVVRVIGGLYRGKKIYFPAAEGLRPSTDRIRETLFNWLLPKIGGARCLDAFAGSGVLGIEALSRGASQVILVEKSRVVCKQLQAGLASLKAEPDKLSLLCTSALIYLEKRQDPFDLIFLDPPFDSDYVATCLELIARNHLLKKGGLIYLESNRPFSTYASCFKVVKEKKAGQVFYGLLGNELEERAYEQPI